MFKHLIKLIEEKRFQELEVYCQAKNPEDFQPSLEENSEFSNNNVIEQYINLINALKNCGDNEIIGKTLSYLRNHDWQCATFLFVLVEKFSIEELAFFISKNVIPATGYDKKFIVLHLIKTGQLEKFILLASNNYIDESTLDLAIQHGQAEIAEHLFAEHYKLFEHKPDEKIKFLAEALNIAVTQHNKPMIALLRKYGAINYLPASELYEGVDVVAQAVSSAESNDISIITMVMANDEDELEHVLAEVVQSGRLDLLRQLFKVNGRLSDRELKIKVLIMALFSGEKQIIEYVLQKLSNFQGYENDLNVPQSDSKYSQPFQFWSPIEAILKSSTLTEPEKIIYIKRLVAMGMKIPLEARDAYSGVRPLIHICAEIGSDTLLSLFAEYGINLHAVDRLGNDALYYAFRSKNISAILYLLSKGLKSKSTISGETILMTILENAVWDDNNRLAAVRIALTVSSEEEIKALSKTTGRNVLHIICDKIPENNLLIQTLLEARVDPNIESIDCYGNRDRVFNSLLRHIRHCDHSRQHKILHNMGLLFDHGLVPQPEALDNYNVEVNGRGVKNYVQALMYESSGNYIEALEILLADATDESGIQPNYIWCRLGMIYQKQGLYAKALDCFLNATDTTKCFGEICDIPIANQLVNLFSVWLNALELQQVRSVASEQQTIAMLTPSQIQVTSTTSAVDEFTDSTHFYELLELIRHLPDDALTPNSHFKLAEIYLKVEGLTFSERQELLIKHFSLVSFGQFKEQAQRYLQYLLSPQNEFKVKLDKILTDFDLTLDAKKAALLSVFAEIPADDINNLKAVGIEFILRHDITKNEATIINDVIKPIRTTARKELLAKVDELISARQSDAAVVLLEKAKSSQLYNVCKYSFFKADSSAAKTKPSALEKIDQRLNEITNARSAKLS